MTSGWHVTHNLNLLSWKTGADSNLISNKFICRTIMILKPNKLQVTRSRPQANALEQVHKVAHCQRYAQIILIEKNHENLEGKKGYSFDFFRYSNAW
jgi:hypothetical protein